MPLTQEQIDAELEAIYADAAIMGHLGVTTKWSLGADIVVTCTACNAEAFLVVFPDAGFCTVRTDPLISGYSLRNCRCLCVPSAVRAA